MYYLPETHYLEISLAYELVAKIFDKNPLQTLASNFSRLKASSGLSNDRLNAAVKKAGLKASSKTFSNIERAEHNPGVGTVAAVAAALHADLWQMFIPDMPEEAKARADLSRLVKAFTLLSDEGREVLLGPVEGLAIKEGKLDELNRTTERRRPTDGEDRRPM